MKEINIRKARKEDIEEMVEIVKTNFPEYDTNLALKELQEMFSKSLIRPTYIVIDKDGEIIAFGGFIPSWIDNNIFNIFWVNTKQDYQRKGIGTLLMKDMIKRIRSETNPVAKLIVIATDKVGFYNQLGFTETLLNYDKNYCLMSLRLK